MVDTSCWVAAMVEAHPAHARSRRMLERIMLDERDVLLVYAHSLAEVYAVLTRLPLKPRIGPDVARRLVRENIETSAKIVSLTSRDYAAVLDRMADSGLSGGVVCDALILRAAEKAGAKRLLTLNETDFRRVGRESRVTIVTP